MQIQPKRIKNRDSDKYRYLHVHRSIIHISQKVETTHQCPSVNEWINKLWYICTMEYYSSIRRNEVLIYLTVCMSLTNIMLSDRSQTQ